MIRTCASARAPARQRGVALLTAIILVALATVLAATLAFDNVLAARRGSAVLAFDQGMQYAQAAEALAAYALREDSRGSSRNVDHAGESWAQPLGPLEIVPGVVLEARLEDLQGRFNVNSLIDANGKPDEAAITRFERLLESLELEPRWASLMADWIDSEPTALVPNGGEDSLYSTQDPPYRPPNAPIWSITELLAMPGFGRERYLKLAPYVAALPRDAKLNVCAAPGIVLDAFSEDQREYGLDPERLTKQREDECYPSLDVYKQQFLGAETAQRLENRLGEQSQWFRLTSIVTLGTTELALYSLLHRESSGPGSTGSVRPILRTYGLE
jgi:general secretion pathway protein K